MNSAPLWFEALLADSSITDLCLNGASDCHIDRGRGMERVEIPHPWSEEAFRQWVLQQLSLSGRSWDARYPFVDARLSGGFRAHVVLPPATPDRILLSLRRLPTAQSRNREHPCQRWSSSPLFEVLADATRAGDSILISGATGSGKSTLMGDLLSLVAATERIVALEDTPELSPEHPHFLSLHSRPPNADGAGEITLRTLLRQTLRMRPDRIILGECRGPEVLELLQALNTGHRGAMATLHANSPREALRRVELLCLLAGGPQMTLSALRELLSLGIQWIAQVRRKSDGTRSIEELWKVDGREGDTILLRPIHAPGKPQWTGHGSTR